MKNELGLNPWLLILKNPRKTIKAIVEFNPNYRLFFLSMIYGFSTMLGIVYNFQIGNKVDFAFIIIPLIILSPLWGYVTFSVNSFFIFFTGKWIGGKGGYKNIRSVMAWSNVPAIISCIMWIFLLSMFGSSLFSRITNMTMLSNFQQITLIVVMFIQFVALIYGLVIYIIALSEVQQFSILKSIFNVIISALVVGVIYFIIVLISRFTCSPFFDCPVLSMGIFN